MILLLKTQRWFGIVITLKKSRLSNDNFYFMQSNRKYKQDIQPCRRTGNAWDTPLQLIWLSLVLFRFSCFDLNDLDGRPFLFLWVWLSDMPQMFIEKKLSVCQTRFCLFTSPFAENIIFIFLQFFEAFRDQRQKALRYGETTSWDLTRVPHFQRKTTI